MREVAKQLGSVDYCTYSLVMLVILSPQHIFHEKIVFVSLVSCSVYVFDRYVPCVLRFVHYVADARCWYALDSANSTATSLKHLLVVTTHFDGSTNLDP
jgi:hypothetical protein